MAHFAKLGVNGKVLSVEVVADADCQGADGTEMESIGVDFLNKTHGSLYGQKLLTIQEVENTITLMVQSILTNLKRIEVTMQVLVILGTKIMTSFGQNNHTQVGLKTQLLLLGTLQLHILQ